MDSYNGTIADANELLREANEKAEKARQGLNAVLAEVNALATAVHTSIQTYIEARSEDWQYTPEGKAVEEWRRLWEAIDTNAVREQDRPEFDDADDGTRDLLDEVPDAPPPAKA